MNRNLRGFCFLCNTELQRLYLKTQSIAFPFPLSYIMLSWSYLLLFYSNIECSKDIAAVPVLLKKKKFLFQQGLFGQDTHL